MVKVLSTLALKGVLERLRPANAELHFDATQAWLPRLRAGEQADLVILTGEAIDALRAEGFVSSSIRLGSSGVGMAVRAGAPHPDISTLESFKAALVSASSVAHSKVGASGLYFAELIQRLGMELRQRVIVEKGPVGLAVARGEAEIGIQQICELLPVPGIDLVGPLPAEIQQVTAFSAGVHARAVDPGGARRLLDALLSPQGRAAMKAGGIDA
ncbi:MAG TPA: substrate-binding domain-containing protein [Burkholderiales bacterium]|nr:substrate-binding domain-containing protein [Burkholderiales bacterium]